jgi:hypothetical protein
MKLVDIGVRTGTDKALFHNFCEIYDNVLQNYRDDEIRFLEIGIQNGYSIRMWKEYFSKSEIVGGDIDDKSFLDDDRIKTYIVNQENPNELLSIPGLFDIIIDDGGHTMLQQQITLSTMFNRLKSGGIFIIEDLHTSVLSFKGYGSFGATINNNTLRLLNDLKNGEMTSNDYFLSEKDFNSLLSDIEIIEIFDVDPVDISQQGCKSITSIIRKK